MPAPSPATTIAETSAPAGARRALYWTATGLTVLSFVSGGAALLAHGEPQVRGLVELGYPAYLATLLGAWKLLGGLAVVVPGRPRLAEWAYAGMAFDLTGAAFSHAAAGHPSAKVVAPLVVLAITAVSWALRPGARALASGR